MFCTKCGTQLNDNAKFCTTCGSAVAADPVTPIVTEEETQVLTPETNEVQEPVANVQEAPVVEPQPVPVAEPVKAPQPTQNAYNYNQQPQQGSYNSGQPVQPPQNNYGYRPPLTGYYTPTETVKNVLRENLASPMFLTIVILFSVILFFNLISPLFTTSSLAYVFELLEEVM